MEVLDLKNRLVAVLGFGVEGRATAKYLLKHGVTPVLFDQKPWEQWSEIEKLEIKKLGLNFIFGPDCFKELAGFEVTFRSPGIKPERVTSNKLQVTSQTKWFFEHCPAKIIGVTGTKGKGTTSSLIYEILKNQLLISNFQFPKIYLTGNIGKIPAMEILDNLTAEDWVVYELSSFQLQDLKASPHVGVVLMVTSEHLDYHKNEEEYVQAKAPILKFQKDTDYAVINSDFKNSVLIGTLGKGQKRHFSTQSQKGDCFVQGGFIYAKLRAFGKAEPFISTTDLLLRGEHNWQNICAAILAADSAGCSPEVIKSSVTEFKGLEHRLEFVAEQGGIKFYNDSFSTTPETAIAAIKSFKEDLVVILGGSTKNSDFTELAQTILESKNIKAIILIGDEGFRIKQALNRAGTFTNLVFTGAKNMQEIFGQIKSVAKSGDCILLSPACASFGMFKNYIERGEQFKQLAQTYES